MSDSVLIISIIIFGISFLTPFLIYCKFGRKFKNVPEDVYRRELPDEIKPAVVNAILNGKGKPNMDGFVATIMDLSERGYISFREKYIRINGKISRELFLSFEKDIDDDLWVLEKQVYLFLKRYMEGDEILWRKLQWKLKADNYYFTFFNEWKETVAFEACYEYFYKETGYFWCLAAGLIMILYTVFMFFIIDLSPGMVLLCAPVGILGGGLWIFTSIAPIELGQWTKEGHDFSIQWMGFANYLKDYSMIHEHPPTSVIIWNHYLIYAMALGIANKAIENMELTLHLNFNGKVATKPKFYQGFRESYTISEKMEKNNH